MDLTAVRQSARIESILKLFDPLRVTGGFPSSRTSSKGLVRTLLFAFGLTILSVLASAVLAEQRLRGIGNAADRITHETSPAIQHFSTARTELRSVQARLADVLIRAATDRPVGGARAALEGARQEFAQALERGQALPTRGTERQVWTAIAEELPVMNAAIDDVLARLDAGDLSGAAAVQEGRAQPTIEGVVAALWRAVELNAHESAVLAEEISRTRANARVWAWIIDSAVVVLATLVAFLLLRVVRRFTKLTEIRVSELEMFAGRVAHDIRSPLQSVALVLEFAGRSAKIEPKTTAMLERGSRTVQRIGQIVDGLLVFARSGGTPPGDAQSQLAPVLTDTIAEMRPAATDKGIDLDVITPMPSATLACGSGTLISMLSNLVGNAIKYMGEQPIKQIEVGVVDLGNRMRVEVIDTGPGVPADLRQRIFDPYARGAASTIPGIGLGLATVRRLAEAHHGRVGVDPNPRGGSIFWFEIPKADHNGLSRASHVMAEAR